MIAILDFGSQTAQLVARRLRDHHIYCKIFNLDEPETVTDEQPDGFILSGGPASVYDTGSPQIPDYVINSGKPILGICYGMQAMTHKLGGVVAASGRREYGSADIEVNGPNPILGGSQQVWMSHGDRIERVPPGFTPIAGSVNSPIAAMADLQRNYFGLQFHPEVRHTVGGAEILRRFAVQVCGVRTDWTSSSIAEQSIAAIREQVGKEGAIVAISGGVDSCVAAALAHRAVGEQLMAIFVDTGLLRKGEPSNVAETLRKHLNLELIVVDASREFLEDLKGITEPEEKRSRIGERFIRVFERETKALGRPHFLIQGTIYPDVIESREPERNQAQRIKSHHNVGGLPEEMDFELVEPLRTLFKDEVRRVGKELGLPDELVYRQPFPGPGLAVRCVGEVTSERLKWLRNADAIFVSELESEGLINQQHAPIAQAFAALLPVYSVGVMGDQRTYQECVALRAITTEDYMTADWARLPGDLLARVSRRIVNEVDGVNRVLYDVSSKPPATIEWE
ncbi:MAG: glutamine-hydrolyzing GMP synthase [Anaerolineales bacterium]